jgi:hypothetical protein
MDKYEIQLLQNEITSAAETEKRHSSIFTSKNPSTAPTILAMFFNLGWMHALVYGITGRPKLSAY